MFGTSTKNKRYKDTKKHRMNDCEVCAKVSNYKPFFSEQTLFMDSLWQK